MTIYQNPLHDVAAMHARLKTRIAQDGRRTITDTIPPDPVRRARSLRHCHLPAEARPLITWRRDNGRYVPELAAAIEDDPNLSDGARRCARKIAEYTYRRNRDTRASEVTVGYLARGLGRCRRSVQRYLRQLEAAGYVEVDVMASSRSRLCVGLVVQLLKPLFPKHHAENWPIQLDVPGMTAVSLKQRFRYKTYLISRELWAVRCCDAIHRAYMKTLPAFTPLP